VSDEAHIPLAAVRWQTARPLASVEACHTVVSTEDQVVAASSDLLWFQSDAKIPLRLAVDGSALADLAVVGGEQEIALACTPSGQVFRRARFASQAEQLTRFREPLRLLPGSRARLSFGGALSTRGGRVFLWSRDGVLLDVQDSGDRFERLSLEGKVVAVARESATALLVHGPGCSLVRFEGKRHTTQPLGGAVSRLAQSPELCLATVQNAVALAGYRLGLWVSSDGGNAFRPVAGCGNITAVAGAALGDSPRFFAAVYREMSDQTEILLVDPERGAAVCIARLDSAIEHSPSDAIERGEWAKVERLSWHAGSGRLWAAGGFGVVCFSEPQ
jgi:hypothetical protein